MSAQPWPSDKDWIEVVGPEKEQILADVNRFIPAFPFDSVNLQLHKLSLDFYSDQYSLVHFKESETNKHAFALVASGDIHPLDFSSQPIYRVNELAPITLKSIESAARYLQFFLLHYRNTAENTRYLLIEYEHTLWRFVDKSTLDDSVLRSLVELIKPLKCTNCIDNRLPDWFEFDALLLSNTDLYQTRIIVERNGVVRFDDAHPPVLRRGKLALLSDSRVDDDALIRPSRSTRPVRWVGAWEEVKDQDEVKVFESSLDAGSKDAHSVSKHLRRSRLSFYRENVFLGEFIYSRSDSSSITHSYAIYKCVYVDDETTKQRKFIHFKPLDGRSDAIHDTNSSVGISFDSDEKRIDYIKFFCWAVSGDEGNFHVVEKFRDIPWSLVPSDKDKRSEIAEKLIPVHKDNENQFIATVCYSNTIFKTRFSVEDDGAIEMVDDEPLINDLELADEETRNAWPRDWHKHRPPHAKSALNHYLSEECGSIPESDNTRHPDLEQIGSVTFLSLLQDSGMVADKEIVDDVTFPCNKEVDYQVYVKNVTFKGNFSIRNVRFKRSVLFCSCRFEQGFNSKDSAIEGSFLVLNSKLYPPEDKYTAFDAQDLKVDGRFVLINLESFGRFFAPQIKVGSDAVISGLRILKDKKLKDNQSHQSDFPYDWLDQMNRPIHQTLRDAIDELRRTLSSKPNPEDWCLPLDALVLRGSVIGGDLSLSPTYDEPEAGYVFYPLHERTVVGGNVDMTTCQIKGNLKLNSACILGNLDLQGIRITGFMSCIADVDRVSSTRARFQVTGNLDIRFGKIEQYVTLDGADIGGDLQLLAANINGSLSAEGEIPLLIGGSFEFSAARIGWIAFAGARVQKEVNAITGEFGQLTFNEELIRTSEIDKPETFWIHPCQAGNARFKRIHVKEKMSLSGLKIEAAGQQQDDNQQQDNLEITLSNIDADLVLGQANTVELCVRRHKLTPASIRWQKEKKKAGENASSASKPFFDFSPPSNRDLGGSIQGDLRLDGTTIGGDLDMTGVTVGREIGLPDVTVRRDVRAPTFAGERMEGNRVHTTCRLLNMEMLNVGGDIDLTGIIVNKDMPDEVEPLMLKREAEYAGGVLARGINVKGSIEFASENGECARIEALLDLHAAEANELVISGALFGKNISAHGAGGCRMTTIHILGYVKKLAYLPIRTLLFLVALFVDPLFRVCVRCANLRCPDYKMISAGLVFTFSTFRGFLEALKHALIWRLRSNCLQQLRPKDKNHLIDEAHTALEKLASEDKPIRIQVFSRFLSMLLPGKVKNSDPQLRLERAKLELLDILRPFPHAIDLSGIRVGTWKAPADDMATILKQITPFDRGTYLEVEKALRNKGYDSHARAIYRQMRRESERELSGFRLLFSKFIGAFTGYWTMPWLPMLWSVPVFLLTFIVFLDDVNVAPVTGILEVQELKKGQVLSLNDRLAQTPLGELNIPWTKQDAFGMTIRYFIPVVSLFPAERWIPARSEIYFSAPSCTAAWSATQRTDIKKLRNDCNQQGRRMSAPLTPEMFALIVSGYMWIAWSFFLIGISGVIRREK